MSKPKKYVDLKLNGRLFPSWVLANFGQYKLPEIIRNGGEDACNPTSGVKKELRKYQVFISKFLDYNSPYKDMLIYYGVGSGKTNAAINIYNTLYNYSPGWNVYIILPASLKDDPWRKDLDEWLQSDEKDYRLKNITFISYDAPNADSQFLTAVKGADTSKKNLYIFDEAHGFGNNIYSNITTQQGKRAITIYDHIIQDKKENDGTRVLLLSATPAINKPFELALLFNLLRPGCFPKSELTFNEEYVLNGNYPVLNPTKKNEFQRRIMGLVTYYIGATPDMYASKKLESIDVEMDKYQSDVYDYFEEREETMEKKMRNRGSKSGSFKTYTRQACNFVFPQMSQGYTAESRPRPAAYKISEKELNKIDQGLIENEKGTEKYYNAQNYLNACNKFITLFEQYLKKASDKDIESGYTLADDVKTYREKYKNDYEDFEKNEPKKSTLYQELHKCSAKYLHVIFNIFTSKGPVLVYTNYVTMEGLQMFKIYLGCFGYSLYKSEDSGEDNFRYIQYHGGIDMKERKFNLGVFNSPNNIYGKICKILMISAAGSQGLSTKNVRQAHIIEPYWHEVRILQLIGRAVRMCGHKDLPLEERTVAVFRYKSIRKNGKRTTDQYIENAAKSKEGLLQSFLDPIKEVAIDCVLNKAHNALAGEYKCFQFEEPSLFEKQIGPAYKDDYNDDMKFDNGSNSLGSKTIRIKVGKITAVKQLSKPDEPPNYSKPKNYWYNNDTGVVYDYDLKFAIGKVGMDDDDLPKKLDKDTYIIDKVIPIPMLTGDDV